jgi:alpha-1,3-mannosyl-glycoprotein beta-1,2-N-acetylglucosaminyltransferase
MRHQFESVIILEEDLEISVDFFSFFNAMEPVLVKDQSSLFCVSGWNDNGKQTLINMANVELVHRSDFFPGLGWMLLRNFWLEIKDKWPVSFWDDWLREIDQRKGRSCLRPEVSRTSISSKYGKAGVSS